MNMLFGNAGIAYRILHWKKGGSMPQKVLVHNISIYIPKDKLARRPVERLQKLASKRDRSVNYLVVDAILQYLDREEKR